MLENEQIAVAKSSIDLSQIFSASASPASMDFIISPVWEKRPFDRCGTEQLPMANSRLFRQLQVSAACPGQGWCVRSGHLAGASAQGFLDQRCPADSCAEREEDGVLNPRSTEPRFAEQCRVAIIATGTGWPRARYSCNSSRPILQADPACMIQLPSIAAKPPRGQHSAPVERQSRCR